MVYESILLANLNLLLHVTQCNQATSSATDTYGYNIGTRHYKPSSTTTTGTTKTMREPPSKWKDDIVKVEARDRPLWESKGEAYV